MKLWRVDPKNKYWIQGWTGTEWGELFFTSPAFGTEEDAQLAAVAPQLLAVLKLTKTALMKLNENKLLVNFEGTMVYIDDLVEEAILKAEGHRDDMGDG